MTDVQLRTIGVVRATTEGFHAEIEPQYRAGLDGLEGFGYINVLFWCHHLDSPEPRSLLTCPKPYRTAPENLGVFATRSPARPNPLALTVCGVIGVDRERGRIDLAFIDAEDGSPIVDIKPYHPATDRVRDVTVPEWSAHWPKWYEDNATFDWAAEFVNAR